MTARTWFLAAAVVWAMSFASASGLAAERPFEGLRALVVEPENFWSWDTAIFGALEERGFDVSYGAIPGDQTSLARYDLVALNIKRSLTAKESEDLERYVSEGGAVYGSWGGPMESPSFMQKVCRAGATKSLRIRRINLLDSPVSKGIADRALDMPENVGHMSAGANGWEIVSVQALEGGIPVAQDDAGSTLGVLSAYGKGRTAVLGFGPEQEKYLVKRQLGPVMLDNLLTWLLQDKPASPERGHSGSVTIALPARAQIREVYLNGKLLAAPATKRVGSLRKVTIPVAEIGPGQEAQVRITYAGLSNARNVETVIHLPWATMRSAAKSPARLADYLQSLGASAVHPLLRGSFGEAWYKGMPQDKPDDLLVTQYQGNFFADLISECHKRNIKVIGDIYFDNAEPLRAHPEAARVDRKGEVVKDQYGRTLACFNNPKGQEHTLATIAQMFQDYAVDGVVLDDNFELDKEECYCAYCKDAFRKYCEAKGIAYADPATAQGAVAAAWKEHRCEATREIGAKVRAIAGARGLPAGGWVGTSMDPSRLRAVLDFLGGMVYTEPPRAARASLSVLGDCGFVCLLWAPDVDPQQMADEAREAVRSGCAAIGFWIRGKDGGYEMDAERTEAMRRGLTGAEQEWLAFYRDSILSGDTRFAVAEGKLGAGELSLRLKNAGSNVDARITGPLDLAGLQPNR